MLDITCKDFVLTQAIKDHSLGSFNNLSKISGYGVEKGHLILNQHNNHQFHAEFIVKSKFGEVVSKSKGEDLYHTISDAKSKIATQLQKKHDDHVKHGKV